MKFVWQVLSSVKHLTIKMWIKILNDGNKGSIQREEKIVVLVYYLMVVKGGVKKKRKKEGN